MSYHLAAATASEGGNRIQTLPVNHAPRIEKKLGLTNGSLSDEHIHVVQGPNKDLHRIYSNPFQIRVAPVGYQHPEHTHALMNWLISEDMKQQYTLEESMTTNKTKTSIRESMEFVMNNKKEHKLVAKATAPEVFECPYCSKRYDMAKTHWPHPSAIQCCGEVGHAIKVNPADLHESHFLQYEMNGKSMHFDTWKDAVTAKHGEGVTIHRDLGSRGQLSGTAHATINNRKEEVGHWRNATGYVHDKPKSLVEAAILNESTKAIYSIGADGSHKVKIVKDGRVVAVHTRKHRGDLESYVHNKYLHRQERGRHVSQPLASRSLISESATLKEGFEVQSTHTTADGDEWHLKHNSLGGGKNGKQHPNAYSMIVRVKQKGKSTQNDSGGYSAWKIGKPAYILTHWRALTKSNGSMSAIDTANAQRKLKESQVEPEDMDDTKALNEKKRVNESVDDQINDKIAKHQNAFKKLISDRAQFKKPRGPLDLEHGPTYKTVTTPKPKPGFYHCHGCGHELPKDDQYLDSGYCHGCAKDKYS